MKTTLALLGAAALLCGAATAADWNGLSGSLTGGINHTDFDGFDFDALDAGLAVNYNTGNGISIQANGGYQRIDVSGVTADTWSVGGAMVWRTKEVALAGFGNYYRMSVEGIGIDYETFGLVGEYYYDETITLRARGAGMSTVDENGAYYGGGASYYVIPDLSLSADASYTTFSGLQWTALTAGVEYLPMPDFPLTASLAYVRTMYAASGSVNSNSIMFHLTYRFGQSGSLVDMDRSGPINLYSVPVLPI